jgi:hypothetical protein
VARKTRYALSNLYTDAPCQLFFEREIKAERHHVTVMNLKKSKATFYQSWAINIFFKSDIR